MLALKQTEILHESYKRATLAGKRISGHGGKLERAFETHLVDLDYKQAFSIEELHNIKGGAYMRQPIVAKESFFPGRPLKLDFLLKDIHDNLLAIECKFQNSGGSVDQKLYFVGESLKITCPYPSLIILMGNGFSKPVLAYLHTLIGSKIRAVLHYEQIEYWMPAVINGNHRLLGDLSTLLAAHSQQLEFDFKNELSSQSNQLNFKL